MKYEKVEWKAFMAGEHRCPTKLQVVAEHVERNKVVYRVAGATVILLLASDVSAHASANDAVAVFAHAGGGIDAKANEIYYGKLLAFGKWAIIIKGGWGAIHKLIQEDFEGSKKTFFSYLVVYLMLLAFPWAMNEMDGMFR